jgi:hypothetical protein
MVPLVCGIFVLGFYKLFELFICKKERLLIIEKMGEKFTPDMLEHKLNFSSIGNMSFSALKFGCLFMGFGLGLLAAFAIHYNFEDFLFKKWEIQTTVYGASVLLFGGLGLLIAFLIELNINKNK